MDEAIVIFGKTSRAGEVKTRMTPALSPQQAAQLYRAFARDVMETVRRYCERGEKRDVRRRGVLCWKGERTDKLAEFAADEMGFEVIGQETGSLGDRLRGAFRTVRADGADRVIALGTDSPTLSPEYLSTATLVLENNDVVFGPAFDGGYVLVGVGDTEPEKQRPEEVIFDEIDWSTPRVMEQSWHRARGAGLLCELLGFWYDLDTFEDLRKARFYLETYLPSRDPMVGRHTRRALESFPSITDEG